ncbi:MAG: hypothetical protein K2M55_00520 [Muribaculaceae bacterium]|nr:hypothetical protein [Muribaculaceae bacterium]
MILPLAILAMVLPLLLWTYITVLRRHRLLAPSRPAERTDMSVPVGGGIVFILGALVPLFFTDCPTRIWWIMAGGGLLATISFADDIVTISPRVRLIVQIAVFALVLTQIVAPSAQHAIYILALLACVGYTNASNFMDGINGMLALYGLAVLGTILAAIPTAAPISVPDTTSELISLTANGLDSPVGFARALQYILAGLTVAVGVFAFFNCRQRALVFAGDVGSVTLGYFIAIALVWLAVTLETVSVAVFVAVYVVDTFCTFLERLRRGEAVMQAHKSHLYQRLTASPKGRPERKSNPLNPLAVSGAYAALQLAINIGWLLLPDSLRLAYAALVTLLLLAVYHRLRK